MDNFLLINFKLNRELDTFVQENIYNYDITGFEIDDPLEKRQLLLEMPEWEMTDMTFEDEGNISYGVYFTDDSSGCDEAAKMIAFFEKKIQGFSYEENKIDNSNWEEEWKKTYTSFPIGDRIWIKPSWEEDTVDNKIVIEIEPKTAFGTGTHETTSLCMEYVENEDFSGKRILDIGCGSGILSILASKLGADHIDACDIDEFALENAIDNSRINGVNNVDVFYSNLFSAVDGKYDLIFANILAEILVVMLDEAQDHLNKGGRLILSGIILEKVELVRDKLKEKGFNIEDEIVKGEWALIAACK